MKQKTIYNTDRLYVANPEIMSAVQCAATVDEMRTILTSMTQPLDIAADEDPAILARVQDCTRVLRNILKKRTDELTGFSLAQALWDIGHGVERLDLTPGFYAEMFHILLGLRGEGTFQAFTNISLSAIESQGRPAAIERSLQLDSLWQEVERCLDRFAFGLDDEAVHRRRLRRAKILQVLGGTDLDWQDWRWHVHHIIRDAAQLDQLVVIDDEQRQALIAAQAKGLHFGITPYYLSLMDDELGDRDAAIRAQVLPPMDYVDSVYASTEGVDMDFMREEDTSPIDLITRRYPSICILKPFNTCPQICVYCQRNWEIDDAMASNAFAGIHKIDEAIQWIGDHPAIREVLITGGDPLAMGDRALAEILKKVAALPSVERIRIGTRTLVTIPMRITEKLADLLASFRKPGRRTVTVITHVQHSYEITPEMVTAVNRLRLRGIPVYNQLVFTFFASRRFEAAALRRRLRMIGIDPYYTFNTKGKEETLAYRVPIARLLQEQQEETRLLPGLERTDEAVFNLPRLGKNYLKSREHRDLLTILADGSRIYEFYPWEKFITQTTQTYLATDVPILDYLERLAVRGEEISDYQTIWYYF
ncbi:MAG: KamA family radical SAM protein [Bacteroidetes bacterium]|nr:KamA family radical SAM protein [Bacteroidota bacterium]